MPPRYRFLHAADLHLDSPLHGLERYEGAPIEAIRSSTRQALENLVQLAEAQRVAFVILAGDIYDGDWNDANTGLFFVSQMARLHSAGIPVYLISGNHDAANRMTRSLPYPPNVHRFGTESPHTYIHEALQVALHGQSYANQSVEHNLAAHYPDAVPGWFNIGILHTSLDGREGHASYAPCKLEDLQARGYHYWALGHVHQRETVNADSPRVEFPGNIQGRHIRELGPKGCLIAEVDGLHRVSCVFHAVDVLRWARTDVRCPNSTTLGEIEDIASKQMEEQLEQADGRPLAIRIRIVGTCPLHDILHARRSEVTENLRSRAISLGRGKVWLEKVEITTQPTQKSTGGDALPNEAMAELLRLIEELRADPARLLDVIEGTELFELQKKLPAIVRDGDEATMLTSPDWLLPLLDEVPSLMSLRRGEQS